jgi:hypothetical protein
MLDKWSHTVVVVVVVVVTYYCISKALLLRQGCSLSPNLFKIYVYGQPYQRKER